MVVKKYIIYFIIEGDIRLLIDDGLPSIILNKNITIHTADKILDRIYFDYVYKYHSELSELDQSDELSIIEYCLISPTTPIKGKFKGIFNVEQDQDIPERQKEWIKNASQKI